MNYKIIWKIYFALIIAYGLILIVLLTRYQELSFSVADVVQAIFILGLFGFAFSRRIGSRKLWKVVFGIALLVFLHTWAVLPSIFMFSEGIPFYKVMMMQMFNIPFLPLLLALYLYAWRSEDIWRVGT